MTSIERRVLAYLNQRGGTARRQEVVCDLAHPDSKLGRGIVRGSNGGTPRIMGRWCARLVKDGLVKVVTTRDGFYDHHAITEAGRKALRQDTGP